MIEAADAAWIPGFLQDRPSDSSLPPIDKSLLFPEPEEANNACCPFHSWADFDATRSEDVIELYTAAQTFAKVHIMSAPIVMLGQDVLLDPEKFVIRGNSIRVLGTDSLTPVNFAACWNAGGLPGNYIDVAATVDTAHFLVPPIPFTESADSYHLRFDFIRNSWMVKNQQVTIPVPMVHDGVCDDGEPYPWRFAVDEFSLFTDSASDKRKADLWWVDNPALEDEMRDVFD
ncbi:hypothetical protein B7755_035500 [Streptomyces sp. NBS 14/10]|uniref:hypothetical protein n=1 Tax=Streptomyces sp. NBS 14/10 TaxID=1945643 RepID=UPI000B7FCCB1|nr:hypothetical protein [Streptomyces sp. NBS 14/10]KAK1182975.1 hypothetical protein B7755_035500 [Streptomyces sp. NBS 14/10]NUS83406.1 hypothetical protein [Streptomyces sp.]